MSKRVKPIARLSDIIEDFIRDLILCSDGTIELRRNEIANKFKCVPSQINYVIDTRFTNERGYYVESRRGGGGCIIIKEVKVEKSNYFMHTINSIGDCISQSKAYAFIDNILEYGLINNRELMLMKASTNDKVILVSSQDRDCIRARILKNMIITLVNNS